MARSTDAALYEVAYDEAVRALSTQERAAEDLRGRAGLLLSAATVATSFLGARALDASRPTLVSWIALTAFVAAALATLAILWPRRWEFAADARRVIMTSIERPEPAGIEDLHRELSLDMHASYAQNRRIFDQLTALFQLATGLLVVEVTLWCIAFVAAEA